MMNRGVVLYIVCLWAILPVSVYSQEKFLRQYTVKDGLPSFETYSAFQDSKGYIWIASDMGVGRFDGYNFKIFTTADGLTDNTVFKFYEDYKGRIWFNTFSGKLCYYYNDTVYGGQMPVNNHITNFLGLGSVNTFKVVPGDTLYLGTTKGLLRFTPQCNGNICMWDNMAIVDNRRSELIAGGGYFTQTSLNATTDIVRHYPDKPEQKINVNSGLGGFNKVVELWDKRFLVFFNDSLYVVNHASTITTRYELASVICAVQESDSTVWIGRLHKGMALYSINDFSKPLRLFLRSFSVTGVLKDREKGYWFTTLEEGLFYMPSNSISFYAVPGDTLANNQITVRVMGADRIWAISERKINEWTAANGFREIIPWVVKDYVVPNSRIINNFWNAYVHSDGHIWVSTNIGIAVLNSADYSLYRYIHLDIPKYVPFYSSRVVMEDRNKDVWSLNHEQIIKIDHNTYQPVKRLILPSRAESLCESYDGRILIGTVNGLYALSGDSVNYLGNENGIFKNRVIDVKKGGGKVVVATRGAGVYIIDKDSIYQVTTANGMRSNMCRTLYIDGHNTIWVGTNNGLSALTYTTNPFKVTVNSFSTSDGLPSDDILKVDKQGSSMWLLTKRGICSFNPGHVKLNDTPPPVYITRLRIDNAVQPVATTRQLSYTVNFIGIDFVGLTYKTAGKQNYKYKLEGYDTAWTYTNNTFVQFTKLPPGNYRFVVKCINSSQVESALPAVYAFTVNTPFYQKWWFSLVLLLLSIAVVVLVAALYIRRIRGRERTKTEINRKIANLELHALRAQMNPHFIFNCLNAIQDFILKNEPMQAKHYLSSFSKLIRKTLDNSRRQSIALTDEVEFLYLYLGLERMRFVEKFDYSIVVADDIKDTHLEIPSMILQPFIENAIRHSRIGSLETQGQLKIKFRLDGNTLICTIDDNGIGVSQSLKNKAPGRKTGVHAFDIINDRVRTMNELLGINIRYTITDKLDAGEAESGTRVEIFIPFISDDDE